MMEGKKIRLERILAGDGKAVVIAFDHGRIAGPAQGIGSPGKAVREAIAGGADAALVTRGFLSASLGEWNRSLGVVLRMTGGFTTLGGGFEEEVICQPADALRCGADCAAYTVKFGHPLEGRFIRQAALAAAECGAAGIPVMVEAMPFRDGMQARDAEAIALAARAAQEIGADIVKTSYTGDPVSFRDVVEGCPAPVLILGGEKTGDLEGLFSAVYWSVQAGGAGIAMGRNIWSGGDSRRIVEAMAGIVHEGWTIGQALAHVRTA